MAAVHTNLTQPIKYKESPLFAIFVTVLMTLCKLGLKMLALFCTFLVRLELWVNVPVAIFLPMVDCTVHLALNANVFDRTNRNRQPSMVR